MELSPLWAEVAHAWTPWIHPVAPAAIDALLCRLVLPRGAAVADFGCGKGELLIRLAEAGDRDIQGIGVDHYRPFIQAAKAAAEHRVPGAGLVFRCAEAQPLIARTHKVDFAVCMGAELFGKSWAETLDGLADLVRPGGYVLGGEGFVVGGDEPQLTHAGLIAIGRTLRLELIGTATATPKECLAYEERCYESAVAWCDAHPDGQRNKAVRQSCDIWYDMWQVRTDGVAFGHGLYLFRVRQS